MSDDPANSAGRPPGRAQKHFVRGFFLVLVCGIAAAVVLHFERRPERSIVAHGKELATIQGCFACHGTSEADPRANLRKTSTGEWKPKSIPTFWENGIDRVDVLVDWITHGVPAEEAEAHKRLFIQMPAYEKFMSPADIEAITAWILSDAIRLTQGSPQPTADLQTLDATKVAQLDPDRLLILGDRLARKHACYQCHGEFGQGGAANPESFKEYIPGFFGHDFRKLTKDGDREEILHWIDHGRGRDIEAGALGSLAKKYLDAQAIGMPGYHDQLTAVEKTILTEYLLLLNKKGPLSAKELERLLKFLNEDTHEHS